MTVAIWDSDVDPSFFRGRMWTDVKAQDRSKDAAQQNLVRGLHGIAFDTKGEKTFKPLWPLTEEEKQQTQTLRALTKGGFDVFDQPESSEAQLFRKTMSRTRPAEMGHLLAELDDFRRASHGTGCAFVAAAGNPFIRILSAQTAFGRTS